MFKKNTISFPKTKTIKVKFDDFERNVEPSSEPLKKESDRPKIAYNFKVENGFLEDGYGVKELSLPYNKNDKTEHLVNTQNKEIVGVWGFNWFDYNNLNNDTFIFFIDKNFDVFYFYEYTYMDTLFPAELELTSMPVVGEHRVDRNNMLVFSSPTDDLIVYGGGIEIYKFPNAKKFASCCVHENVFYAIDLEDCCKIVWTKDFDPLNVENTAFNEYHFKGGEGGRFRQLFSLHDYVYIFRDTAIVKVSAYSSSNPLSVTHIYYSSSFIIPQTTKRCGEYIVFLTREGLHLFNGTDVSKVDLEVFDLIDMTNYETFASATQNGKYFLSCKMNFADGEKVGCENSESGYKNNALLVFDLESGKVEIMRGVDISDLAPIESNIMSKMLCSFNNDNITKLGEITKDGKIFGEEVLKKWESVSTDFGYAGNKKVVKSISLYAQSDCQVTIKSETDSKTIFVEGKDKLQKIKTLVKGKIFEVSFSSLTSGQKISSPELEVEVLL